MEPLLEAVRIEDWLSWPPPSSLDWVIVGGESGPGARAFHLEWGQELLNVCRVKGVKFFFKQLGSNAYLGGARMQLEDSKGGDISEFPEDLQARE